MSDAVYPVPAEWAANALVDEAGYFAMYRQSVEDPEAFWAEHGQRLDWIKPYTKVKNTSFHEADFGIRWFEDGTLNLSANCLDRHLATRGDDIAILWEPDGPGEPHREITYRQLHEDVCRFANLLKSRGVKRGERVTIYLPMVPEAAVAMLACTRIGAIHSIVFAGFSSDALGGGGVTGARDPLPDVLRDERHHGVQRAQRGLEHVQQHLGRLLGQRAVVTVQQRLAQLQVPVAELVPHEVVERLAAFVQAVGLYARVGGGQGHVQAGENPAVGKRRDRRAHASGPRVRVPRGACRLPLFTILALQAPQHVARGVPQLVGEVAVALDALDGERDAARLRPLLDIAPDRRWRGGHSRARL